MFRRISKCAALMLVAGLALTGCSAAPAGSGSGEAEAIEAKEFGAKAGRQPVEVKPSPDKYTWYIKDYVGMNAAAIGYTALDGSRRDAYGSGTLRVVFVTEDGTYLDYDPEAPEGEEADPDEFLKEYKVVAQNITPNSEMKYTFMLDENGEEYDALVDAQSYDEIVLAVAPVGEGSSQTELTEIQASPDKYTRYVKDYVGRNLATCGYLSLGGTYNDHYGQGYIQFDITADDGSYIDVEDEASLRSYVVTGQSVEPNSPITFEFMVDSSTGEEYSNLVQSQSVESINLTVTRVAE